MSKLQHRRCLLPSAELILFWFVCILGERCLQDSAASTWRRPVGKAHLYVQSDLPERFPDQFEPFKLFGFQPEYATHNNPAPL